MQQVLIVLACRIVCVFSRSVFSELLGVMGCFFSRLNAPQASSNPRQRFSGHICRDTSPSTNGLSFVDRVGGKPQGHHNHNGRGDSHDFSFQKCEIHETMQAKWEHYSIINAEKLYTFDSLAMSKTESGSIWRWNIAM